MGGSHPIVISECSLVFLCFGLGQNFGRRKRPWFLGRWVVQKFPLK